MDDSLARLVKLAEALSGPLTATIALAGLVLLLRRVDKLIPLLDSALRRLVIRNNGLELDMRDRPKSRQ